MTSSTRSRDEAFAFATSEDWARAVPAARKALAADPQDAYAQALLALGLAHVDQPREAVDSTRRAVALDPELWFAHYSLGWALLRNGDIRGAERSVREALGLDANVDAFALLGDILVCDQRWQEVLEVAGLGLELDPAHTGCANVRACALGRLRQPAEGEDAVTEALVVNAEDALSHATRGWLLLRQ